MKESVVDFKIFKAHSSRSTSTSAATNAGVAINNILKQGNRANASTCLLRKSPYSVRKRENAYQRKLRIWTFFTQW